MIQIENLLIKEDAIMEKHILPDVIENPESKEHVMESHGFITLSGDLYVDQDKEKEYEPLDFLQRLTSYDKSIAGGKLSDYNKDKWITHNGILVLVKDKIVYLDSYVKLNDLDSSTSQFISQTFLKAKYKNPLYDFKIHNFKE